MEAPQGVELTGTNGGKAITQHAMLFLVLPVLRPSACSPGREHPFGPRNEFASIVRFPNRHMPPSPRRGGDRLKICGDHSQGETPGPIPNPEAKALHGDGTAPERVWESSTSPLTLLDRIPVEPLRGVPGVLFVYPGVGPNDTDGTDAAKRSQKDTGELLGIPVLSDSIPPGRERYCRKRHSTHVTIHCA